MEGVVCPFCHQENRSTVTHCTHCGEQLLPDSFNGAASFAISETTDSPDCQEFLNVLAGDSLALFVDDTNKQIIIPQLEEIVLGRLKGEDEQNVCDLTSLGELASGVSRRHAVIRKTGSGYSLKDLNSTNGTSLNGIRLEPGEARTLNCQDTIKLASLRLTVCFHTAVKTELTEMRLHKRNQLALETRKLYPNFMSTHLVPYLEAVAALQRVVSLSQSQPPSEPRIFKIIEDKASILISMDLDVCVRRIITHTLLPWREENTEYIGWSDAENDAWFGEQLNGLVNQVLSVVAPKEEVAVKSKEELQTAVAAIITSPLEPAFSKETD